MEHRDRVTELVASTFENLENQHDWTDLKIHTHDEGGALLPRPLITGLPPRRVYLHPDDQIEMLRTRSVHEIEETPVTEWVLAAHLNEKMTIRDFAAVFDALEKLQPSTPTRPNRVLLATIHDDSTIVYYFVHNGIVKPRQN